MVTDHHLRRNHATRQICFQNQQNDFPLPLTSTTSTFSLCVTGILMQT